MERAQRGDRESFRILADGSAARLYSIAYLMLGDSDLAQDAVQEFMYRLHRIYEQIADNEHAYLVSIILDGENAWESYEDNGDPFFRELYGALSNDPSVRTVTLNEYLQAKPPRQKLQRLAAGSWINGNFDKWIGEPMQNLAWDLLGQTRQALVDWQRDYALAPYDATAMTQSKTFAATFESAAKASGQAKLVANWMMGEVSRRLNARCSAAWHS